MVNWNNRATPKNHNPSSPKKSNFSPKKFIDPEHILDQQDSLETEID